MPESALQLPITWTVVGLRVVVGKVKETLDPVQGHFGLQEAIDHPREVVEGKNEHSHQSQGSKYLSRGEAGVKHHLKPRSYLKACSVGGPTDRSVEGRWSRAERLAGQSLGQRWQTWPCQGS